MDKYIKTFDSFNIQAIKLENSYNAARTATEEMVAVIEDLLFLSEKNQKVDAVSMLGLIKHSLKDIEDKYFTANYEEALKAHIAAVDGAIRAERKKVSILDKAKKVAGSGASKNEVSAETVKVLEGLKKTAKELLGQPQYNFFRIGYYVYKNPKTDLSRMSAEEANAMAGKFLDEDFMNEFMVLAKMAVQQSFGKTLANKKAAIEALEKTIAFFKAGNFTEKEAEAACKQVNDSVLAAIDPLAIVKDNVAYTFGGAIRREVEKYFFYIKNNPKEEARFARQTAQ